MPHIARPISLGRSASLNAYLCCCIGYLTLYTIVNTLPALPDIPERKQILVLPVRTLAAVFQTVDEIAHDKS